jgi:hypothetical protein
VVRLNALDGEMKRAGCISPGSTAFQEVASTMGSDPHGPGAHQGGVRIEPGKPMIDVSRR